ncbi:MAG: metalloregulator ArsR/SmtB family transcription factor [Candidatus Lokiarchaeota archaeon]|nr:metalloregulator ArsR/SmtB family transcription factor [Candidatus Lokiarchaeota archaeon]
MGNKPGKRNNFDLKLIETLGKCSDIKDAKQFYEELIQIKERAFEDPIKSEIATILEAFSNKDRFIIIDALRKKDRCVCELEAILQKSQATVSHHLKILRDVKLVYGWPKGKFTHYSLIKETFKRFKENIVDWLESIENWYTIANIIGDTD